MERADILYERGKKKRKEEERTREGNSDAERLNDFSKNRGKRVPRRSEGWRKFDLSERDGEEGGQGAEIALLSRQIPTAFSFRFVLLLLLVQTSPLPLSTGFSWGRIDKHRGLHATSDSIRRNKIRTAAWTLANFSLPYSPPVFSRLIVHENYERTHSPHLHSPHSTFLCTFCNFLLK